MKFRTNIIFSFVMHLTIFTAALALAGKDAVLHLPERFTLVRLLEDTPVQKTAASDAEKKKRPSITAGNPVTRLRSAPAPEATQATQRQEKEPAAAVFRNKPFEDGAVAIGSSPAADGAAALQTSIVSGPSQGGMLAIPGKPATQSGPEGRQNKNGQGAVDAVNTIRAAIERAKSYPPLARKRGLEGTTTTEFTIDEKGCPENIRIVRSSGSDILDNAAKNTVLRASPFPQVSGSVKVPITFRIDK